MASKDKKTVRSISGGRRLSGGNGIRTLADLNRHSGHYSDSDTTDSDDDHSAPPPPPPPLKSGMLVQGAPKGNDVGEIFNHARELGAIEGPVNNLSSTSFTGTTSARRLSGDATAVPAASLPPLPDQPVTHNIVFWRNGFTINDGPVRRLDDPENAPFLESIRKSECPKELEPAERTAVPVHVNLIRRDENCPEHEKRTFPFQGVGRTLGGTSSSTRLDLAPSNSTPLPSVDPNQPSTSIQLRLLDGTRMVAHFNYHHTVNDIRAFIDASRPGGSRAYHLQTVGFPPKPLNDLSQTIEQAGLANSVVMQKL